MAQIVTAQWDLPGQAEPVKLQVRVEHPEHLPLVMALMNLGGHAMLLGANMGGGAAIEGMHVMTDDE